MLLKCVSGPQAGWNFVPVRTHVTSCVCVCVVVVGGGASRVPLKEASVAIMQDRPSHRNDRAPGLLRSYEHVHAFSHACLCYHQHHPPSRRC